MLCGRSLHGLSPQVCFIRLPQGNAIEGLRPVVESARLRADAAVAVNGAARLSMWGVIVEALSLPPGLLISVGNTG